MRRALITLNCRKLLCLALFVSGLSTIIYAQVTVAAVSPVIRPTLPPESLYPPQEELPLPAFPSASYPKGWPDITIAFESDALCALPSEISKLNRFGAALRASPKLRIHIAGHSARFGNPDGRILSSWKRAQMVADYLVSNGYVMPDRIDIGGYGAEYPAADNDTWTNRQKNRRVEIFILK